jgi:hypothetical protein
MCGRVFSSVNFRASGRPLVPMLIETDINSP